MKFRSGFVSNSSSSSYVLVLKKEKYDEIVKNIKFNIDNEVLKDIICPSDIYEDLVMVSGGCNEDGSYINNYYSDKYEDEDLSEELGELITNFEDELDNNAILKYSDYR